MEILFPNTLFLEQSWGIVKHKAFSVLGKLEPFCPDFSNGVFKKLFSIFILGDFPFEGFTFDFKEWFIQGGYILRFYNLFNWGTLFGPSHIKWGAFCIH